MSIESLKAQARRHERNEEWQEALEQYGRAIRQLADDDQPDIGLYNRVGDLYVRVGNYERALEHYEKAVELYREAYLHNNAIAVCKKIVRHVPVRSQVYLTMGQIRAEQGFLSDARTNFLTYAERMQGEGDLDESFRALVEFCDLAPEDVDLRVTVAEQMAASERTDEALQQLGLAWRAFKEAEQDDRAFGLERRIVELDPEFDFEAVMAADEADAAADFATSYGEVDLDGDAEAGAETPRDEELAPPAVAGPTPDLPEPALADADAFSFGDDADGGMEGATDLPMMEGTEVWAEEDEGEAVELPFLTVDDAEGETGDADWPAFDESLALDAAGEAEDEAAARRAEAFEEAAGAGEPEEAEPLPELGAPARRIEPDPGPPAREADPGPAGSDAADAEGWVDLGSMIFGDEPAEPRTTRFKVAYQEPSGDELADFQKMLSQFKEKVSENLDASDVKAHYDLGTAYKEMGLLDEAISEFQAALRAAPGHLPTYELMGQTFMEMGKHEAAVKALERALKVPDSVEDELVAIYYHLARAYESLGRNESAVEFYDRVFSLDINFADVTERLRALR